MKKLLLLFGFLILIAANTGAQTIKNIKNILSVYASYGDNNEYVVTGNLDRSFSSLKQGDYLYYMLPNACGRFTVKSLINKKGKTVTVSIIDEEGKGVNPSKGIFYVVGKSKPLFKYKKDLPIELKLCTDNTYSNERDIRDFVKDSVIVRAFSSVCGIQRGKGGVGITVPDKVYSVQVNGDTSSLSDQKEFTVYIKSNNAAIASTVQVINTSSIIGGGPSDSLPFITLNDPGIQVKTVILANGVNAIKLTGLDRYNNWILKLNF